MNVSVNAVNSPRIIFFGDSTTAYRENLKVASILVGEKLKKNQIFNSGCPGATTEKARQLFSQDVLGLYPDIAIIMLGTNDLAIDYAKGDKVPRVSIKRYGENLLYFVTKLKNNGCNVVLMSLPPVFISEDNHKKIKPDTRANSRIVEYSNVVKKISREQKTLFVDINETFWKEAKVENCSLQKFFSDGVHPNQKGQDLIADTLIKALKETPEMFNRNNIFSRNIECMHIKKSLCGWEYNDKIQFKIIFIENTARLQYRFKDYAGKSGKTFGEWIDVSFEINNSYMTGNVKLPRHQKYALQFRILDLKKNVIALGIIDN